MSVSERERFTNIHTRLCVRLITWLTSTNYLRQVCVCVCECACLPVCLCKCVCVWVCKPDAEPMAEQLLRTSNPHTHSHACTHSHAHTSLTDRTHIRWPVHMTEPAACAGRIRRWLIRSNLQSLRGGASVACVAMRPPAPTTALRE